MTEAEWLGSEDPRGMLRWLESRASARKLRLFACACCRRVWPLLKHGRSQQAIEVAERYADGLSAEHERAAACQAARLLDWEFTRERGKGDSAQMMANYAAWSASNEDRAFRVCRVGEQTAAEESSFSAALAVGYQLLQETQRNVVKRRRRQVVEGRRAEKAAQAREFAAQVALLRCVFGNPFRPVPALDPAWLSWNGGTIPKLAQAIYDEHRFADLPILADALEEAGCDNADVLAHCRSAGEHARGCWPVDWLLGRT